ncbi:MAG: hypothetical protein ACYC7D_15250 [Nitrososphaerales archaeon]
MVAREQVSQAQRERLMIFFGNIAADCILRHVDDLESVFGSASRIIVMVMDGKILPKE